MGRMARRCGAAAAAAIALTVLGTLWLAPAAVGSSSTSTSTSTSTSSSELLAKQLEKDAERLRGNAERTPAHLQQAFRAHFQLKRREQIAAAEAIFEKPRFSFRFQLLLPLVDEIFRQLNTARKRLVEEGWTPSTPFTTESPATLDALAQTWQNVAFFGDLILRMPDPVRSASEPSL